MPTGKEEHRSTVQRLLSRNALNRWLVRMLRLIERVGSASASIRSALRSTTAKRFTEHLTSAANDAALAHRELQRLQQFEMADQVALPWVIPCPGFHAILLIVHCSLFIIAWGWWRTSEVTSRPLSSIMKKLGGQPQQALRWGSHTTAS